MTTVIDETEFSDKAEDDIAPDKSGLHPGEENYMTGPDGEPNAEKNLPKMKEFHTDINFEVKGTIMIFSNFFFIKKLFKLVTNVSKDMARKRKKLISKIEDPDILKNIQVGFDYIKKLREMALERME